jgi:transcriptional regulator with XRE-family HTH domain
MSEWRLIMVAPAYSSLELVRESYDARVPAERADATRAASAEIHREEHIPQTSAQEANDALEYLVGVNLARLRAERQLSLDALARASGVSRAMLAQIESARSVPSIKVLHKIAGALKVSVAAFLRRHATNGIEFLAADQATRLVTSNGRFSARPLFPSSAPASAEFHELRIAPLHTETGSPKPPGTTVNLVVSDGTLELRVHDRTQLLGTGDAIVFDADQPHALRNPGSTEARAYQVTVNAETPPRWHVPADSRRVEETN